MTQTFSLMQHDPFFLAKLKPLGGSQRSHTHTISQCQRGSHAKVAERPSWGFEAIGIRSLFHLFHGPFLIFFASIGVFLSDIFLRGYGSIIAIRSVLSFFLAQLFDYPQSITPGREPLPRVSRRPRDIACRSLPWHRRLQLVDAGGIHPKKVPQVLTHRQMSAVPKLDFHGLAGVGNLLPPILKLVS